jgi:hypothetical protein
MKNILNNYIHFLVLLCILFLHLADNLFAQSENFSIKDNTEKSQLFIGSDGKVAIDTSATLGTLTINGLDGLIATGTFGSGTALNLGAGTRFMWYPKKGALRVGYAIDTDWDDINIGNYSTSLGYGTIASGNSSIAIGWMTEASGLNSIAFGENTHAIGNRGTAMGYSTIASGANSTAMGTNTEANGMFSTAIGTNTIASGDYSTAMGDHTTASGNYSTSMGSNTLASGEGSTAIGNSSVASGDVSTVIGQNSIANGNFSTAMGCQASTNNYEGAFVVGDNSTTTLLNASSDNQFSSRFANGYNLYTNADMNVGATLGANQTSWSAVSDSTKKENFLPVNGEKILQKIRSFKLRSWNFKNADLKTDRHYGPMAQEFFNAFGHDDYGVIGNDTTINSGDFDGINLIAIQALEKRTEELQNVKEELAQLKDAYKTIVERLEKVENKFNEESMVKTAIFTNK